MILPSRHFDARKQCRRPVSLVIVRECAKSSGKHRQTLLRAVESLNLALFVARNHQRMFRRIQIQSDHIDQFFDESRIVRDLERLDQVRLQPAVLPYSANHRIADVHRLCQRSSGPMRGVGGFFLSCLANDFRSHGSAPSRFASPARRILLDALQPLAGESVSPSADGASVASKLVGDFVVPLSVCRRQNDVGALHKPCGRASPTRPFQQRRSFLARQRYPPLRLA